MPLYTVLAPPLPEPSAPDDPISYFFVKDGFCWPCLFVPVMWMVFRRLWLVLLPYLVVVALIVGAERTAGGPLPVLFALFGHVWFAFEANGFRRWTLRRHGYRLIGVAAGRRVGEAETRFFHEVEFPRHDPRQPPPARLNAILGGPLFPLPRVASAESGEVVGFFPSPGGSP
jgi:hypothetical protein